MGPHRRHPPDQVAQTRLRRGRVGPAQAAAGGGSAGEQSPGKSHGGEQQGDHRHEARGGELRHDEGEQDRGRGQARQDDADRRERTHPRQGLADEAGQGPQVLARPRRRGEDRLGGPRPQPRRGPGLDGEAEVGDRRAEAGQKQSGGGERAQRDQRQLGRREAPAVEQDRRLAVVVAGQRQGDPQEGQEVRAAAGEDRDEVAQA